MDGKRRADIRPGQQVEIVLKKDQPTGRRTRGVGYTHCRLRRGHGFYACDVYSGFREDEPGGEGGRGRKVNIPTADIVNCQTKCNRN